MIPISVASAFDAAGVLWQAQGAAGQRRVPSVSTDTRELDAGALFVALDGPNFDGAAFARQAVERGASAVLARDSEGTRASLAALASERDVAVGTVPSGRAALAGLARCVRSRIHAPLIGITGSVGKTSVKDALRTLGAAAGQSVVASRASFNNEIGVPRTLFEVDARTDLVAVEIGTNAPGEIAALSSIAAPSVAVLTRVGRSHLEGLGSLEGVAREKAAIFESLTGSPAPGSPAPRVDGRPHITNEARTCVLGHDTPLREELIARVPHGARLLTVSAEGDPTASLFALRVRSGSDGTRFVVRGDGAGALCGQELHVPLLGRHAVANVLLALAALGAAGVAAPDCLAGLAQLEPAPHRLAAREVGDVTLIDDAYNANPESFRAAVAVLAEQPGPKTLVAGPMAELGHAAERLHAELGAAVARAGIERAVLVDPDGAPGDARLDALARGLGDGVEVVRTASVDGAVTAALDPEPGAILVKASRSSRLERAVDAIADRLLAVDASSAPIPAAGVHRT